MAEIYSDLIKSISVYALAVQTYMQSNYAATHTHTHARRYIQVTFTSLRLCKKIASFIVKS